MKMNSNDMKIVSKMHRLFTELADLQVQLSNKTKDIMLEYHNEYYNIIHCIRWGEIGINELKMELEYYHGGLKEI